MARLNAGAETWTETFALECYSSASIHIYSQISMECLGTLTSLLPSVMRGNPVKSPFPLTMEQLRHYEGFVLYRTRVTQTFGKNVTLTASGRVEPRCVNPEISIGPSLSRWHTSPPPSSSPWSWLRYFEWGAPRNSFQDETGKEFHFSLLRPKRRSTRDSSRA